MAEKSKVSERTHPLFDENISSWEFYEKSVKGGTEYFEEAYLFSHRLEHDDDFQNRKARAYYLNFADETVQTFTNYIMKEPVERPDDTILEVFRKNTNNKGDDITAFMRRIARVAATYGQCHIIVDAPKLVTNVISKQQQKEQELYPYCTIVLPTKLKDWSIDSNGKLNWVLIEEDVFEDADPKVDRAEQTTFKVISRDGWERYDQDGNSLESGDNPLGEVFMVTNYHRDIDIDLIGESLIKDISYVNRIIYNWCSLIDEQIERQTFSQLVIPDDGSLADEDEKADPLKKIGTSSIWTFPSDATQAPRFIAPETSTISVIWDMIIAHIREIHRLAGLTGVSEDLYSPQRSGRSQQYSFLNINASLAAKAAHLQRTENALNRLCYLWQNKDPEKLESVCYPNSFDISGLADSMATTFAIAEREVSKRLNKELLKKLSLKALPLATESIKTQIEAEIESGDGTIKTASEIQQEAIPDDVGRPAKSPNKDTNLSDVQRSLRASTKQAEPSSGVPRKRK